MDFALTEEQRALRSNIIRFARERLSAGADERDRNHTFPRDLWSQCGTMRLQGLPVPHEWGGAGLDALSTAIALDALGYGCTDAGLVFSLCAHLLACVVPLWKFGTEEQKQRYLAALCNGSLIAVNAMTEPDSGSDAFALKTRAEPADGGYRISGTKIFASNAPVADLALVFAVTDPVKGYHGGISAFLVERDSKGFSTSAPLDKMGLRASPTGELVLDEVWVSRNALLGGEGGGARVFAHSMDWERACLFASHAGQMERLLETAIGYARTRRQFGAPIGSNQAISHRIADMKVMLEAARLLVYRAAWSLDHSRSASLDASIAKLFTSESLVRSALDTMHIFGGYGFMTETQVERAVRDALASTVYSGTSEMQRNIIARWLGL